MSDSQGVTKYESPAKRFVKRNALTEKRTRQALHIQHLLFLLEPMIIDLLSQEESRLRRATETLESNMSARRGSPIRLHEGALILLPHVDPNEWWYSGAHNHEVLDLPRFVVRPVASQIQVYVQAIFDGFELHWDWGTVEAVAEGILMISLRALEHSVHLASKQILQSMALMGFLTQGFIDRLIRHSEYQLLKTVSITTPGASLKAASWMARYSSSPVAPFFLGQREAILALPGVIHLHPACGDDDPNKTQLYIPVERYGKTYLFRFHSVEGKLAWGWAGISEQEAFVLGCYKALTQKLVALLQRPIPDFLQNLRRFCQRGTGTSAT